MLWNKVEGTAITNTYWDKYIFKTLTSQRPVRFLAKIGVKMTKSTYKYTIEVAGIIWKIFCFQ